MGFFIIPTETFAAACASQSGGGNWSDATKWSCGHAPTTGDTVSITSGNDVVLDQDAVVTSIIIDSGAALSEDGGGHTLAVSGGWTNNGTFTPNQSTVRFSSTQTFIGNTTFYNLLINTGSSIPRTITMTGYTATVAGTFTFDNTNTGTVLLTGGTVAVQGDVTWDGLDTPTNNTTTLSIIGTGDQTLTYLNGSDTAGSFLPFNIDKPSGTIHLSGTIRTTTNWTYTRGDIDATADNSKVVFAGFLTISGSHTLNDVRFDRNHGTLNGTYTLSSGTILTVDSTLEIENSQAGTGSWHMSGGEIEAKGNVIIDSASLSTTQSTTLLFSGSNDQSLIVNNATASVGYFPPVEINKSGGMLTVSGDIREASSNSSRWTYVAGNVDMTTNDVTLYASIGMHIDGQGTNSTMTFGNLRIIGSTITLDGDLTLSGNLTIDSGKTLTTSASNYNVSIGGNWSNAGTYTSGSNTTTFYGSGTSVIDTGGTGTAQDFQNFTVDKSGGGIVQLVANGLNVDGTLTVSGGILDLNGQPVSTTAACNITGTLKLTGDETISCTPTLNTGSTVEYSATSGTRAIKAWDYSNSSITINGSGGTFTDSGPRTIGGDFTLTAGSFTATADTMNIAGNYSNQGTFDANSGTIVLNGADQSVSGSTTFNNLTKNVTAAHTITFDHSGTQTIVGILTLQGQAGNLLSLRSDLENSEWSIDPQGSRVLNYLDVEDSNNINVAPIAITGHNITLTGENNTGWGAPADNTPPTVSITAPENGATVGGATVTLSADASDNDAVAGVQFKLDTDTDIGDELTLAPYAMVWDSTSITEGSHTISAVAHDASGNYSTSMEITITIDHDSASPWVYITSPQDRSIVSGTAVSLTAIATDNKAIAGIQFKLDGNVNIGSEITASPYSVQWNSTQTSEGVHTISAVAHDARGNSATSTFTITVGNKLQDLYDLLPAAPATSVLLQMPANSQKIYVDNSLVADCTSGNYSIGGRNCSGSDGNAYNTLQEAANVVQAGQTVLVREGIYTDIGVSDIRGKITVRLKQSGQAGLPIAFEAYPGEEPILDGSDLLGGWQPCQSQVDCAGNQNWQSIYKTAITPGITAESLNMYQGDNLLFVAQDPIPADPHYYLDTGNWHITPSNTGTSGLTLTSLQDPSIFTQTDPDYWTGAYVIINTCNNNDVFRTIDAYDPDEHMISFDDLGCSSNFIEPGVDTYTLYNNTHSITVPGEYAVDEANGNVYLYPIDDTNLNNISVSVRNKGFDLRGQDYIIISGFKMQKYVGNAITNYKFDETCTTDTIVIENNIVTKNKGGNIEISCGQNILVKENTILDNISIASTNDGRGIQMAGSNINVIDNYIERVGGTAIYFGGVVNGMIANNILINNNGQHANGLTVYQNSSDVAVKNNIVINSNIALTFESSKNLTIEGNLFTEDGSGTIDGWSGLYNGVNPDGIIIKNNTFPNKSLYISSDFVDSILKNNIIGGIGTGTGLIHNNNLFTQLSYDQSYDLGTYSESYESDRNKIFIDSQNRDYRLEDADVGNPVVPTYTMADDGGPVGALWLIVSSFLDTTPPAVTSFTLPSTSSSLTVSIDSFAATDDTEVTGYLVSESSSTPSLSDPSWSSTPQTQYIFSSQGTKTLYAFARDAAGNISGNMNDSVIITLPDDPTPPPPPSHSGGGGGSSNTKPTVSSPTSLAFSNIRLIIDGETFFVVKDGKRYGVTDPGILNSWGLDFSDGIGATKEDMALPYPDTLKPGDGSLVRTEGDSTVFLIFDNQRHGFVSESVFLSLGYSFNNVLSVTPNELNALPQGNIIDSSDIAHPSGTFIQSGMTIYRVFQGKRYGIPDMSVFDSLTSDNGLSFVIPANQHDMDLEYGGTLEGRRVN